MEEQSIQRQIQQIQKRSSEIQKNNTAKEIEIQLLNKQLIGLENQLTSIIISNRQIDLSTLQSQITSLNQISLDLIHHIQHQNNSSVNAVQQYKKQVCRLQLDRQSLNDQYNHHHIISKKQLEEIQNNHLLISRQIQNENIHLKSQNDLLNQQKRVLSKLQEEISQINAKQVEQKNQLSRIQANSHQKVDLLKKLQEQQNLLKSIQIQIEETSKRVHLQQRNIKDKILSQKDKLKGQQSKIFRLQQQQNTLKSSLAQQTRKIEETQKINQLKSKQLENAEKKIALNETEVTRLKAGNDNKRKQIAEEELRIAEQLKKSQNRKNYKDLIRKAESEYEGLLRIKQNEQNVLNNTIKTKSSYSNRESLSILERQLTRHHNPKSVSLDQKSYELQKLQRTNNNLKEYVKKLNKLRQQQQKSEQKHLSELQKKGNDNLQSKKEIQKELNMTNQKLTQYTKNFPNFEKDKQAKKKTKLKKTDSIQIHHYLQEANQKPIKEKKKGKKRKEQNQSEQFIILDDQTQATQASSQPFGSQVFKKTKWYRRRSSNDFQQSPDVPIYRNTYFLIAVGLILLLIVAISF